MTNTTENLMVNNTREYMRHTITLTDQWQFVVSGPEFEGERHRYTITFQSYEDATKEIQKRAEDSAKVNVQKVSIDLDVLDEDGKVVSLSRINRQNGELMGVEGRLIYPNLPWIRTALEQRKAAKALALQLDEKLSKFGIRANRHYSRIDAAAYQGHVTSLLNEHAGKLEAAKKEATLTVVSDKVG